MPVQSNVGLIILAMVAVLAALAEFMVSRRFKTVANIFAYVVEELNKIIIQSSFRYTNVFRFFVRVLRGLGVDRSSMLLKALMKLQNPSEAFMNFANLPNYKSVQELVMMDKK